MSRVNQELVKIYFEMNGFLVKRDKQFLILNLKPQPLNPSPAFLLKPIDIPTIERAAIEIKGWHTDKFFPSRIRHSPEIFDFVQLEALKITEAFFGGNKFKKILVVSHLPAKGEMREKSIILLQEKGIDHALEFAGILRYLICKVKPTHNYINSDLLQLLRLLKCYHLLQEPQLELF